MEEAHVTKAQVAGQQDVQYFVAAEAFGITRHYVQHEDFRLHVTRQAARLFAGGQLPLFGVQSIQPVEVLGLIAATQATYQAIVRRLRFCRAFARSAAPCRARLPGCSVSRRASRGCIRRLLIGRIGSLGYSPGVAGLVLRLRIQQV